MVKEQKRRVRVLYKKDLYVYMYIVYVYIYVYMCVFMCVCVFIMKHVTSICVHIDLS